MFGQCKMKSANCKNCKIHDRHNATWDVFVILHFSLCILHFALRLFGCGRGRARSRGAVGRQRLWLLTSNS